MEAIPLQGAKRLASEHSVRQPSRPKVYGLTEFLSLDIPPREYILSPVLQSQGLAMVYARRGVGKTWITLSMAYAVASGGQFLKWEAPTPRQVLVVDGEMPGAALQERLAGIARRFDRQPQPDFLRLLAADLQGDMVLPDLASREGQRLIESELRDAELLVLDNLSTLCRGGRENEAESWDAMQAWLLSLRRRGVSVLLVHHAGKGGNQRGTSKREDTLDTVISLRHPEDYSPDQGARFEVHLEKARGLHGDEATSFEACLGQEGWTWHSIEDIRHRQIIDLHNDGLKQREIAAELGCGLGTVNRHINKARADGEIS